MLFDDPALNKLKTQFQDNYVFVEGIVKPHEKGYGFLETKEKSYFINPINMRKLLAGDIIKARIEVDIKGSEQAIPDKLIESRFKNFVGQVNIKNKALTLTVLPESYALRLEVPAISQIDTKFSAGDWVYAEVLSHPLVDKKLSAKITKFICKNSDPFAPWWITLHRFNQVQEIELTELSQDPNNIPREDLTQLNFLTIDSSTTLDIDDAIYLEKDENSPDQYWKLFIAIADPTSYIKEGSQLDKHTSLMGLTQYMPGFNIPLIPRKLAEDVCSLKENVVRPTIVSIISFTQQGVMTDAKFMIASIKSKAKLNYTEVSDYLEQNIDISSISQEIKSQLKLLEKFSSSRILWRSTHSLLFEDKPDYSFRIDPNGQIIDIVVSSRRIANKIVEEAMIAANIAAARFFIKNNAQAIFSTHSGYLDINFEFINSYLASKLEPLDYKSIQDDSNHLMELSHYIKVHQFLLAHGYNHVILFLRQYLNFSTFNVEALPHFAMGLQNYATWTSPIRKYSDMVNHRIIKDIILTGSSRRTIGEKTIDNIIKARKKNRQIERALNNWLYDLYFRNQDNTTIYNAEIIDIIKAGLRAVLIDSGAQVFISFSSFQENNFHNSFQEKEFSIQNQEFKLGDKIQVMITKINPSNHKMSGKLIF